MIKFQTNTVLNLKEPFRLGTNLYNYHFTAPLTVQRTHFKSQNLQIGLVHFRRNDVESTVTNCSWNVM